LHSRKDLQDTYIITRVGLRNGLGEYFKNPLHKPILSEFARWDILNGTILATQFSWEKSTYAHVHTSNVISRNNWILDSYELVIINTDNNNIHEIAKLGTTVETGTAGNCRLSPDTHKASCLQGKGIVVFDIESGNELLRETYKGGVLHNFDKLEWISDDEIVLLENRFAGDYEKNILRLNVNTGELKEVCDTNIIWRFKNGVLDSRYPIDSITCSDLPEFAALYGSKEWPVDSKLPSASPAGDRFYFYPRWIPEDGFLYPGKTWIEGYDRETGNKFYVATVDSILKSIFGDIFIVDWFGWSWF